MEGTMNTRTKLALAVLASLSCALAQADTETRDVSGFTAIDASGGINVDIRIGNEFLVEVDTDEDLDDIETEVRGDTLYLRIDREEWNWNGNWGDDYSAVIVMPALSELEVSGGSDVQVTGVVSGDEFELNASGG